MLNNNSFFVENGLLVLSLCCKCNLNKNMDSLIQALQYFFSEYIVALAVVIIAAVWGIWKLASAFQSMRDKVKDIDELPCAHHTSKIDKHDEQFSDTRALMSRMEGQLELLVQNSIEKGNTKIRKRNAPAYSAKHSPRRLNENGISLLEDSGGNEFLKANMGFFIGKMEKLRPKTALDVENMAMALLQMHTNDDMFIPIKNWVYNAPSRELKNDDGTTQMQDVELDDVVFVMSLPIRDRYIELHPEIAQ